MLVKEKELKNVGNRAIERAIWPGRSDSRYLPTIKSSADLLYRLIPVASKMT